MFKFNRMPFGINTASEVFQRAMEQIFARYPCAIIVENIIISGKDAKEHELNLKKVLDRARKVKLRLNKNKCKFGLREVSYVGHVFTGTGLKADPTKIAAIIKMPPLEDKAALQRFLGMVTYLGWFEVDQLSNMSSLCVVNKLKLHFSVHGIPQELYSDNSTQFMSQSFCDFTKSGNFTHATSSPEYPQSNGLSERAMQSAKKLLEVTKRDGTDFYLNLLSLCNTQRDKILGSPAQRLPSRQTQTVLPICKHLLKPEAKSTACVKAQLTKKQETQKRCYDKSSKPLLPLLPNQLMTLQTQKRTTGWAS
ncbi:hypothetical protein MHYP_G00028740 [Metynnis hypsauchen]